MKTTKRIASLNARTTMSAREEYEARIEANENAFREGCVKLGFGNSPLHGADMYEEGRVRVWISTDDETLTILVFSGCPGYSPVQYEIPISLYAPAEIALATLKAALKATAE